MSISEKTPYFVTLRLEGSVSKEHELALRALRRLDFDRFKNERPGEGDRAALLAQREHFHRLDLLLDACEEGPDWLRNFAVSRLFVEALRRFEGLFYELRAFTILPNHVHVLLDFCPRPGERIFNAEPTVERAMNLLKGATSPVLNSILGRSSSERFWATEISARPLFGEKQIETALVYLKNNPVRAGLCAEEALFGNTWARGEAARSMVCG